MSWYLLCCFQRDADKRVFSGYVVKQPYAVFLNMSFPETYPVNTPPIIELHKMHNYLYIGSDKETNFGKVGFF